MQLYKTFFVSLYVLTVSPSVSLAQNCGTLEKDASSCIGTPASYPFIKKYFLSESTLTMFQYTNKCDYDVDVYTLDREGNLSMSPLPSNTSLFKSCELNNCDRFMHWRACAAAQSNSAADTSSEGKDKTDSQAVSAPPETAVKSNDDTGNKPKNNAPAETTEGEPSKQKDVEDAKPPPESAAPSATFVKRQNYDTTGDVLEKIQFDPDTKVGYTTCINMCSINISCISYTYDRWNHLCLTKSSVKSLRFEPRSISGFKSGAKIPETSSGKIVMEKHNQKLFKGTTLSSQDNSTLGECREICTQDLRCLAYSYLFNNSSCQSFSKVDGYDMQVGVVGGLRREPPQP